MIKRTTDGLDGPAESAKNPCPHGKYRYFTGACATCDDADRIVAEAVREERAKIVEWLRREAARYGIRRSLAADAIERGEHEGGGNT